MATATKNIAVETPASKIKKRLTHEVIDKLIADNGSRSAMVRASVGVIDAKNTTRRIEGKLFDKKLTPKDAKAVQALITTYVDGLNEILNRY